MNKSILNGNRVNSPEINSLINRILKRDSGSRFLLVHNADKKCWLMPSKNISTALHLYQPSYWKGKLLKLLLPYLNTIGIASWFLKIEKLYVDLDEELKSLLAGLFKTENIEFSIFCGTPSAHQKITIQISAGKKTLGYCKVTDNDEIKTIFKHEEKILDGLNNKGIRNIPRCLYCGPLKENIELLVQTTEKTIRSKTIHYLNKLHWNFLSDLHNKTMQSIQFEQSDFYEALNSFTTYRKSFADDEAGIIKTAIDRIIDVFKNKTVLFSVYQGDFTPWNIYIEKNELYVFDWEYAKLTYPPFTDAFHFFTQTAIFERKWDAERIFKEYRKLKSYFQSHVENPDLIYQCYLLSIISQYTIRDKGNFEENIKRLIKVWILVLSYIQ